MITSFALYDLSRTNTAHGQYRVAQKSKPLSTIIINRIINRKPG